MARKTVQTKPVSAGFAKPQFEATITDKQRDYRFWRLQPDRGAVTAA
jgi:hypothetical protein